MQSSSSQKILAEVEQPAADMQQKQELTLYEFAKGRALSITAKADFDAALFSKRELRLQESLATEFRDSSAET